MIKELVSENQVITSLEIMQEFMPCIIEYYKENKDIMHACVMYDDIVTGFKELTRGLDKNKLYTIYKNKYLKTNK